MARTVLTIVLQVVIAIALALLLLTGWQAFVGTPPTAFEEAARVLFLFTDVALVAWLVLLIVGAVRRRGLGWGVGGSIAAAILAAMLNVVVVVVVGLIQGGWAALFVLFAIIGGIAFVIGAAVAAVLVQRVLVRPRTA